MVSPSYFIGCAAVLAASVVNSQNVSPAITYPCLTEGYMCIDQCSKLIHCVPNGNNTFAVQQIRQCPGGIGSLCNPDSHDCSGDSCNDLDYLSQPLSCHEPGKYPHPWDCTKYFTCSTGSPVITTCPAGRAYQGEFANCTTDALTARACTERPIPMCSSIEDTGAYPEDKTIFYICAYNSKGYLLPELRRCQIGYLFDEGEEGCIPGSGSSLTVSISTVLGLTGMTAYLKSMF